MWAKRHNPEVKLSEQMCYLCKEQLGNRNLGIRQGHLMHLHCAREYEKTYTPTPTIIVEAPTSSFAEMLQAIQLAHQHARDRLSL